MEVLTFFSRDKDILRKFEDFLDGYFNYQFLESDQDTKFYRKNNVNDIYLHLNYNNVEHEFSYNYSFEEQKKITDYFDSKKLYSFDIQYRNEIILNEIIRDFGNYLIKKCCGNSLDTILSHPINGLMSLEFERI